MKGTLTMKHALRTALWLAVCTTLFFLTGSLSAGAEKLTEAQIRAKVERYLTRYFKLAPHEFVVVNQVWSVEKPPMWGLSVTRKQGGKTQDDVYMLSKDFKTLALGRVLDFARDLDAENLEKVTIAGAPIRGAANAPVTIIQYCDLQCPDCKTMVDNLKSVLPDYGDKVRIAFKNFPLMDKHAWAEAASIAARCGYVQKPEGFWNFYDFFYAEQESVTTKNIREKILQEGKKAGLNTAQLEACYDSKTTIPAIQSDMYEAAKLGVRGTPTILVNGRFIFSEEMTEKDYRKLIDDALAHGK